VHEANAQSGSRLLVGGLAGYDGGSGGANQPVGVDQSGNIRLAGVSPIPPPRAGTIVAVEGNPAGGGVVYALYDDGSFYEYDALTSTSWKFRYNLFGSNPTVATSATWGQMKSTYR